MDFLDEPLEFLRLARAAWIFSKYVSDLEATLLEVFELQARPLVEEPIFLFAIPVRCISVYKRLYVSVWTKLHKLMYRYR